MSFGEDFGPDERRPVNDLSDVRQDEICSAFDSLRAQNNREMQDFQPSGIIQQAVIQIDPSLMIPSEVGSNLYRALRAEIVADLLPEFDSHKCTQRSSKTAIEQVYVHRRNGREPVFSSWSWRQSGSATELARIELVNNERAEQLMAKAVERHPIDEQYQLTPEFIKSAGLTHVELMAMKLAQKYMKRIKVPFDVNRKRDDLVKQMFRPPAPDSSTETDQLMLAISAYEHALAQVDHYNPGVGVDPLYLGLSERYDRLRCLDAERESIRFRRQVFKYTGLLALANARKAGKEVGQTEVVERLPVRVDPTHGGPYQYAQEYAIAQNEILNKS